MKPKRGKKAKPKAPRNKAILVAYSADGERVARFVTSLEAYYEELHAWDRGEFLLEKRNVRIVGDLYDSSGTLTQHFEGHFSPKNGKYTRSRVVFADGTVHDDRRR